ncbi:hypothetical protein QFC21_002166 [Naganishia friedmannii]|uniref:Uncharacterized protein n=1 Tax=Naganishia friedmannii TaxID=89922 RepID=A0ACC2VZQ1_9TREE|nr:hypothetical protein QFC21_002166 [Naganishia friedmannii]
MAPTITNNHPINGHSIWTIIVFFAVKPQNDCSSSGEGKGSPEEDRNAGDGSATPVSASANDEPASEERSHFTLGLATAPVIGVLLLLASTSIGGQVLRNGIVGIQGVKPYDIMTLFISLAYISISLDCTGLLRFLAFWVALKGGTSGRKLYLYFYLFFFVFGVIVGNDPIILSGTSFLAYFSRIAGISPPRAWTFAQFAASNVASAVLVSSNPTNLVLTGAYDISFLVYSAWLVLPVLATSLVLLPLLMFGVFNDEELVPRRLETPDVEPKTALIDRNGAIFGSTLLAITLVSLVTLSAVNLLHGVEGVWTVTAPAAVLMLCRDIWHDLRHGGFQDKQPDMKTQGSGDLDGRQRRTESGERASSSIDGSPRQGQVIEMTETSMESRRPASLTQRFSSVKQPPFTAPSSSTTVPPSGLAPPTNALKPANASANHSPTGPVTTKTSLASTFTALKLRLPTVSYVVSRLPLPLLPFAFSMFILVEALQHVGWIRVWGGWWKAWVEVGGLPGAVWLMATLSVLGCNVSLESACRSFSASLAGLLWKQILAQKGILVGRIEFAKYNAIPVVVCMIIGSLVIAGEVCIMYKS